MHFEDFWKYAIKPAIDRAYLQMDENFKRECKVFIKNEKTYKKQLEKIYKEKREWLKKQYLPAEEKPLLDMHKLSAIMCRSILQCKPIVFNVEAAVKFFEEYCRTKIAEECTSDGTKNRIEFATTNIYVNYKIAFRASIGINYIDLFYRLSVENKKNELKKLEDLGDLIYYKKSDNHENFCNSIVLALAKKEAGNRNFDYLNYATIMYQLQMWTLEQLKS